MAHTYILAILTCAHEKEASSIAHALLQNHLIACAKQVPTKSSFWWAQKIDSSEEILLLMETREDLFAPLEAVVRSMHSYQQFVLIALPILLSSKGVKEWIAHSTLNDKRNENSFK